MSKDLFRSHVAAHLTAAAILLYPTLAAFSHYFWPEVLHLALWGAAFWILASRRRTAAWLLLCGLLLAAAALTRHLLLPFLPVVLVALALEPSSGRWRRLIWLTVPIAVVLGTAMWIDWRDDGRLRSASNATFNAWVGLNDSSRLDLERPIVYDEYLVYLDSAEQPAERDRILRARTLDLIADQGPAALLGRQLGKQYFRLLDHGSFFTEQLPGGRAQDERRGYGEQPAGVVPVLRALNSALYAVVLVAAIWGMASARFDSSSWLRVALLFIAYNLLIFLVLHVKTRYRIQLLPFLILFGAPALERWWLRSRGATATRSLPRWRTATAALATLVVLLLAFAGPLFD